MCSCDVTTLFTYAYKLLHICEHVHEINPFVLYKTRYESLLEDVNYYKKTTSWIVFVHYRVRNCTCRLLLSTTEDFTKGKFVFFGKNVGLAYTFLKVHV